ncbi:MAG: hypothetical protein ABI395_02260 [Sphingobium sp.]
MHGIPTSAPPSPQGWTQGSRPASSSATIRSVTSAYSVLVGRCDCVFAFLIFLTPTTATGAGMAGGRQERTDSPADEGGQHPQDRNEEKDLSAAQVAARRGRTTGQRRPPANSMPEANAIAPARCPRTGAEHRPD